MRWARYTPACVRVEKENIGFDILIGSCNVVLSALCSVSVSVYGITNLTVEISVMPHGDPLNNDKAL